MRSKLVSGARRALLRIWAALRDLEFSREARLGLSIAFMQELDKLGSTQFVLAGRLRHGKVTLPSP